MKSIYVCPFPKQELFYSFVDYKRLYEEVSIYCNKARIECPTIIAGIKTPCAFEYIIMQYDKEHGYVIFLSDRIPDERLGSVAIKAIKKRKRCYSAQHAKMSDIIYFTKNSANCIRNIYHSASFFSALLDMRCPSITISESLDSQSAVMLYERRVTAIILQQNEYYEMLKTLAYQLRRAWQMELHLKDYLLTETKQRDKGMDNVSEFEDYEKNEDLVIDSCAFVHYVFTILLNKDAPIIYSNTNYALMKCVMERSREIEMAYKDRLG